MEIFISLIYPFHKYPCRTKTCDISQTHIIMSTYKYSTAKKLKIKIKTKPSSLYMKTSSRMHKQKNKDMVKL